MSKLNVEQVLAFITGMTACLVLRRPAAQVCVLKMASS